MVKKVAILVEDSVDDREFWYPYYRIQEAGFQPVILGPRAGKKYTGKYGTAIEADAAPGDISPDDVAGVIIPGGWAPDKLRTFDEILGFLREANSAGKMIAAICHAGSLLISAGIVRGVKMTSYRSIKDDLVAAGAEWVDEPIVRWKNFVTSRFPDDLPIFGRTIVEALEGPSSEEQSK